MNTKKAKCDESESKAEEEYGQVKSFGTQSAVCADCRNTSDTLHNNMREFSIRGSNKNEWAVCGIKMYKNPNAARQDE